MRIRSLIPLALLLLVPCTTIASPLTDSLSRCLADNTTGRDRKDLAMWIFVGMAAHPEMKSSALATPDSVATINRTIGALFTKLIGTSCSGEMRRVVKAEGPEGARVAFEYLGKMAMQELMGNNQVNAALMGFERYVDHAKVNAVMSPD